MTFTRSTFVGLLDKLANDQAEVANHEQDINRKDGGDQLQALFDNARRSGTVETRLTKKLFDTRTADTSNPLLKVASDCLTKARAELPFSQTVTPAFHEISLRGFRDELEKLALQPRATRGLSIKPVKTFHVDPGTMASHEISAARPAIGTPEWGKKSIAERLADTRAQAAKTQKPGLFSRLFG